MNKNEKFETVNENGKFNTSKYFGTDFMTTGNHLYTLPKNKNFEDHKIQYCYDILSGMKCNLFEEGDIEVLNYLNKATSLDNLFERIEEFYGAGAFEEWEENYYC